MRWLQSEYILKGAYLGLLLNIGLLQAKTETPDWFSLLLLAGCTLGGVLVALILAAAGKLRQGYRVRGRLPAFVLFLLLESPMLIYAGVLSGTLGGLFLLRGTELGDLFAPLVGGGAALGLVFGVVREVEKRIYRLVLGLLMGVVLIISAAYASGYLGHEPIFDFDESQRQLLSGFLLMGLPFFYLLTFAGRQEESEVEVGAMAALLGVALTPLLQTTQFKSLAFLIPIMLYVWYSIRVLGNLRVLKHVLRGISHSRGGRYRLALIAFRRALELDPNNALAREEFWRVHINLDLNRLQDEPELLQLVDFNLCLERAGSLLMQKPTQEKMREADRLLELVISQRPELSPKAMYWRSVALLHQGKNEEAIGLLNDLVDTDKNKPDDPVRKGVLLHAWILVLMTRQDLREQVGVPQLARPGRRMEAIAAVERHLANDPEDEGVWPLKRLLYQDLTEEEYQSAPVKKLDHSFCQQLGLSLIDDKVRWERGVEYLRMAVRGLASEAPSIMTQIAQTYQREGRESDGWKAYVNLREVGRELGPKNFSDKERGIYFSTVRLLGDHALQENDLDEALINYKLYLEYDKSGKETWRTIASIHERKGDPLAALRANDRALVYDKGDPVLLEKKDSYYYSITPEQVRANLEAVKDEIDVEYCIRKSKALMGHQEIDADLLDWVHHLVSIALVIKPENRPARVLQARVHWRRGEIEEAAKILAEVREPRPERFASNDDEEAWYQSCQLLGDLYLNNLDKPQEAIDCFKDFRNSPKSGARTLFRLGQAFEAIGDKAKAKQYYTQVTAYEDNPLAPEAEEALMRIGG